MAFHFSGATTGANFVNLLSLQPNILINNETPPRACISDFGFCAIAPGMSSDPTTSANAGGTIYYMAPELFLEGAKHSKEADMYAFGIVVYEVVTGARPFTQRRMVEFPLLTTGGSRPNRPEDPVTIGFGQGTWEFAEKCWDGNLERRPTATDALEHFERVAKTSKVVDPGPVIPGYDPADVTPPRPDSSSRNFCECHRHHTVSFPDSTSSPIIFAPAPD